MRARACARRVRIEVWRRRKFLGIGGATGLDWCDLLKAERDEYRQRIAELEHGVPSRYRTWPGAPEVRIPSQLAANQQGSLVTDSPLPHTSPAPTSPITQFFPGAAVFSP